MKRKRLITVAGLQETIRKMMASQSPARKPKPIVRNKHDRGYYPPPRRPITTKATV